jgi:ribulose-5-phosphate 4-epimerase/fuculose-1-phosphate aldolase
MQFYEALSYHDYEGIAFDLDERERLIASLGDNTAMVLRNHGLLTCGRSIAQAFTTMHSLEKACSLQIAAQAGGDLVMPSKAVCERAAAQFNSEADVSTGNSLNQLAWEALLRKLDRQNPGYEA